MIGSPLIVFVAVLASLLEIIDTSIVNVALPDMMGNLGATQDDISMVVTSYAIANAVVLPLSAWLSEKLGRRPYYLGCILAFTVTSVACGLAPNLTTLIIFRILQGLAGGALLPTSQTLIYEQFPKNKAGMAGAIFGMSVMIGPALGPVMGGYLTDTLGWRSIFNINLPLGLLALFIGFTCIKNRQKTESEQHATQGFDALGLVLLVLGIGCLQYTLERGETDDWFSSNVILTTSIIAAICIPFFVWWELRVKNPIINVRLFKNGLVLNGVALMGLLGFYLYALVFILPIFVDRAFHYTATQTGILFIPGSILTAMMMPVIGKSMEKGVNPKFLIAVGFIALEVCMFTMTSFSPFTAKEEIMRSLYIRGFGMAFLFVPINSSILSQFDGASAGQVSGLLNLFRQLGGSFGIALVNTLLTKKSAQNYQDFLPKVSLLNQNTRSAYMQSAQGMGSKMSEMLGITHYNDAAIKSIYGRTMNQVFMLSFTQLLYYIMIILALFVFPLYRLKFKKKIKVVDAH